MKNKEIIIYLMDKYKEALVAIEAEKEWQKKENERVERLRELSKQNGKQEYISRGYYSGRHITKAELNRIRLMLHKAMLEVEKG